MVSITMAQPNTNNKTESVSSDAIETRLPRVCFVARDLGHYSEVWLWRQLAGIKRLKAHAMVWHYVNQRIFGTDGIVVHELDYEAPPEPREKSSRWLFRLRHLPRRNFYGSIGKEAVEIRRILTQTKPDVMLCQFGWTGLRLAPIAQAMGIPMLVHFHGMDLSSALRNRWYRWSLLSAMKHFAAVVVVGSHQSEWMLAHGMPADKVHLIPCGVPVDAFSYSGPRNRDNSVIRFIAVSRLVEKKGYAYTFKAFKKVVDKLPEAKLDVYGEGRLRDELPKLVEELGLSEKVIFHGGVSVEEVRRAMTEADIFVQHSVVASNGDSEGSPVSSMEAAATGLPMVATVSPGFVDQVMDGETGYLVRQRDIDAMAERMVEYFDTKKQIAKLENVLLSCVKGAVQ
jgi:colanic acid/amylovoran biosynthesis glycosyltransferase